MSISEAKEPKATIATSPIAAAKTANNVSIRQATVPRPVETPTPTIQYATAAAANLPAVESPLITNISVSPSSTPAVVHISPKPVAATVTTQSATPSPKAAPATTIQETSIADVVASPEASTTIVEEIKSQPAAPVNPVDSPLITPSITTSVKPIEETLAQTSKTQPIEEVHAF